MSALNPLPLGEPPFEDVEAAAALFVRYGREAPLDEDAARMFMRMVADPEAVLARARELEANLPVLASGAQPRLWLVESGEHRLTMTDGTVLKSTDGIHWVESTAAGA